MPPHLVVIGVSLGGLEALRALIGQVGSVSVGFPLDKKCIQAGRVHIPPPNYHPLAAVPETIFIG